MLKSFFSPQRYSLTLPSPYSADTQPSTTVEYYWILGFQQLVSISPTISSGQDFSRRVEPPKPLCVLSHFQLCTTLCDPMDCSLRGLSLHGILQVRIMEWVAMPSPPGIFLLQQSNPHLLCLLLWQTGSLPLMPPAQSQSKLSPCFLYLEVLALGNSMSPNNVLGSKPTLGNCISEKTQYRRTELYEGIYSWRTTFQPNLEVSKLAGRHS